MQLNGYTLKFYGDFEKTHILKVYEGSVRRATLPISIENDIFEEANKFIPYFEDINGDGHPDLFVPHSKDTNLNFRYAVFLWNNKASMFTDIGVLNDLANIKVNTDQNTVSSSMLIRTVIEEAKPNIPEIYTTEKIFTEYKIIDDVFVKYNEISLTYYSETDIYCYSIYEYDIETKTLECVEERWLSEEKADEITIP